MTTIEVVHGQIIAKANHYQAVPGKDGAKRIIKDEKYAPMNGHSYRNVRYIAINVFQAVLAYLFRCGLIWIIA